MRQISWSDVLEATGLSRDEIEQVVERVLSSTKVVVCWAMGVTQQKYGVATVREIVNFLMLRGNLGRPGTGVCPVRGHSNVQGDRTMGIWEKMPQSFLDALEQEFGFTPPSKHGLDAVDSIRAMRDGRAKLFVGFAGNFVRATPDSEFTEHAMRNCRLTAHISTKLNLSHAVCGETALILPTLGRSDRDIQATGEQFVTVEDSMSIVHQSRGRLTPASEHLLSEVAIVCRLARRTLRDTPAIPWEDFESDYDVIRDAISRVVPDFEDFNARVRKPGGFRLPNPINDYRFNTASGKALFTSNTFDRIRVPPGHLVLQTMRSHDQWNTVPYAPNDRYRGIKNGRRIVLINPADIERAGTGRPPVGRLGEHLGGRCRAARNRFSRDRVSRRARFSSLVLPGNQRARSAGQRRRHQQHTHIQGCIRAVRTSGATQSAVRAAKCRNRQPCTQLSRRIGLQSATHKGASDGTVLAY